MSHVHSLARHHFPLLSVRDSPAFPSLHHASQPQPALRVSVHQTAYKLKGRKWSGLWQNSNKTAPGPASPRTFFRISVQRLQQVPKYHNGEQVSLRCDPQGVTLQAGYQDSADHCASFDKRDTRSPPDDQRVIATSCGRNNRLNLVLYRGILRPLVQGYESFGLQKRSFH